MRRYFTVLELGELNTEEKAHLYCLGSYCLSEKDIKDIFDNLPILNRITYYSDSDSNIFANHLLDDYCSSDFFNETKLRHFSLGIIGNDKYGIIFKSGTVERYIVIISNTVDGDTPVHQLQYNSEFYKDIISFNENM